jgi:hypothetical protein
MSTAERSLPDPPVVMKCPHLARIWIIRALSSGATLRIAQSSRQARRSLDATEFRASCWSRKRRVYWDTGGPIGGPDEASPWVAPRIDAIGGFG